MKINFNCLFIRMRCIDGCDSMAQHYHQTRPGEIEPQYSSDRHEHGGGGGLRYTICTYTNKY